MRTHVRAWGADDAPDLDAVYEDGVSAAEMAKVMQDYPCTQFLLMEAIPAAAIDAALASQED